MNYKNKIKNQEFTNRQSTSYHLQSKKKMFDLKQFLSQNYQMLNQLQDRLAANLQSNRKFQDQSKQELVTLAHLHSQLKQNNHSKICKCYKDTTENANFQIEYFKIQRPITLQIQTKHNWLPNYLLSPLPEKITLNFEYKYQTNSNNSQNQHNNHYIEPNDKFNNTQNQQKLLQIIEYKDQKLICKSSNEQKYLNPLNEVKNIQKISFNQKLKEKLFKEQIKKNQYYQYDFQQFCNNYSVVNATFQDHLHFCNAINTQLYPQLNVIKLKVLDSIESNQCQQIRILISCQGKQSQQIRRVIILQKMEALKYNIKWAKYQTQNFIQPVIFPPGDYIILNLLSHSQTQQQNKVDLIFNDKDLKSIEIKKCNYTLQETFQLLKCSFRECDPSYLNKIQNFNNISQASSSNSLNKIQFFRQNYMNCGIILEIYQNIHSQNVVFVDKNKGLLQQEDKNLLFSQIYKRKHLYDIYQPNELVVKFFEITKMPAKLYLPKKQLIIGGENFMQTKTINSIFK